MKRKTAKNKSPWFTSKGYLFPRKVKAGCLVCGTDCGLSQYQCEGAEITERGK